MINVADRLFADKDASAFAGLRKRRASSFFRNQPTNIPIPDERESFIWDSFPQQTGTADMDWDR